MRASVRVPASTANLGPGYDAFGLALALYNEFEAESADEWSVEVSGEGADTLSTAADNDVVRGIRRVAEEVGSTGLRARVTCRNGIPVGLGLGSSAAAVVGGIALGDALTGAGLSRGRMLEIAAELEGHADNAAAALFGGFVVCARDGARITCARIDPAGGLAVVLVAAEGPLSTASAREALPATVAHTDAADNAARAAFTALGLALGIASHTSAGMSDRIHEPYRRAVVPDLAEVESMLLEAGADGAALSGAGPSVVGIVHGDDDEVALQRARRVAEGAGEALGRAGSRRRVLALGVDRAGITTA